MLYRTLMSTLIIAVLLFLYVAFSDSQPAAPVSPTSVSESPSSYSGFGNN